MRISPVALLVMIFTTSIALAFWPSASSQAQSPVTMAASTAPAVQLITLGTTAGPFPRKDRAQSANLLIVNNALYLIDAGENATRRLVQAGVDFTKVGQVFITHVHNDHTADVPNLISVAWQYHRRDPIAFYGPPGTEEMVQAALQFDRIDAEIRLSETQDTPLEKTVVAHNMGIGQIYQDQNLKVIAAENTHFQFKPGSPAFGKYKSYSYRFQTLDKSVVFTGDTGPSDTVAELAKGADVLVSEVLATDEIRARLVKAGQWQKMSAAEREGWEMHMTQEHLTPEEVGKLAARANAKLLVMTHLSASGADDDDYSRFVTRAAKYFPGKIVVAKDLMQVTP